MNSQGRTIPPTGDRERSQLEKEADRILSEAPEESFAPHPEQWEGTAEVSSFETLVAAHAGFVPLALTGMVATFPDYDPESRRRELEDLMTAVPGAGDCGGRHVVVGELLDLGGFDWTEESQPPGTVCEWCRWKRCGAALYATGQPRGRGKPRRYCPGHQKAARAATARLRRAGVHVGKHRNLVYDFPGLEGQELQGYRDVWAGLNRPDIEASL
ncbi:hypothetical protein [Streptomyces aidingensis]|uniref:hypothetical protein n=1 Tax=Streptomyces aidingensis TaxID=910347 RepID=UPI001115053F|nr:hypothetical protein [Streptomyces aidingensis]